MSAPSLKKLSLGSPVVTENGINVNIGFNVDDYKASNIKSITVTLQPTFGQPVIKLISTLTPLGNNDVQGVIQLDPRTEPGAWTITGVSIATTEDGTIDYSEQYLLNKGFNTILRIPSPRGTLSAVDGLTGERTFELSTIPTTLAGSDGIVDRYRFQTTAAPASPWRIAGFNPIEDVLQIPRELPNRTARPTFFTVAKVVAPDRLLSKSEFKSLRMQQKAASKSAKRIGKTGDGFIYNQMTGELFIDTNGSKKGFGKDGGLLAVLEGSPSISNSNFQLF